MDILLQIIVTGLVTGGVYGLIALGYVLIFKATGVLNLATGALMTLGAFICLIFLTKLGATFWMAFLLTLIAALLMETFVDPQRFRGSIYKGRQLDLCRQQQRVLSHSSGLQR